MEEYSLIGFVAGALVGFVMWFGLRGRRDPLQPPPKIWWIWVGLTGALGLILLAAIYIYQVTFPGEWPHLEIRPFIRGPLVAALLGMAFGGIAPEWVRFIILPVRLATDELKGAHTRWMWVLLTLLVVGIIYPFLPGLLGWLSQASITTPLVSVSLTAHPVTEPGRSAVPLPSGATPEHLLHDPQPPYRFALLQETIDRDLAYARLFLKGKPQLHDLEELHKKNDFASTALVPMAKCVTYYSSVFRGSSMLSDHLRRVLVTYTKMVHENTADKMPTLLSDIRDAISGLESDIPNIPDANKTCAEAKSTIDLTINNLPQIDFKLPYTVLGLSYTLYSVGLIDQAIVEVAQWLDSVPENGQSSLPLWYKARGLWEMSVMLEDSADVRSRISYFEETIHTYEALFNDTDIDSAEQWMKKCSHEDRKLNDREILLEQQLVFSYLGVVDKWLYHTIRAPAIMKETHGDLVTAEMRKYAQQNISADLKCFPNYFAKIGHNADEYRGSYLTQYGTVLAVWANTLPQSNEVERRMRSDALLDARVALEQAVERLTPIAYHEREGPIDRRLDRLFHLGNAQELLQNATETLKTLKYIPR